MKFMNKDRILSIILLAISMFFYFSVHNMRGSGFEGDPGPKMFPYIGILILVLCAVIIFIKPDKSEKKAMLPGGQLKSALKLLGVYALIFVLMLVLGYQVTVPIVLFILCFMFSKVSDPNILLKKNIVRSAVYALAISAALYMLYVFALKTQLPKGLLWEALLK